MMLLREKIRVENTREMPVQCRKRSAPRGAAPVGSNGGGPTRKGAGTGGTTTSPMATTHIYTSMGVSILDEALHEGD